MLGERELTRIYAAAARELRTTLLGVDIASLDEPRAAAVAKRTRRITLRLNLVAERWAKRYLGAAYKTSAAKARTALEILGKKPKNRLSRPGASPKPIQDAALLFLVRANASMQRTAELYLQVAQLAGRVVREAPLQVQEFSYDEASRWLSLFAMDAMKQEKSRGDLKHRILNYLRGLISDDGFIEIKGKFWRAGKYAELVARTTLREAQTKATKDLCAQYDNDLVEFSDHKTICEVCAEFEGKIYSLTGATPGYPLLPEEPPIHPNCKHSLLPTSVEAIEARKRWN